MTANTDHAMDPAPPPRRSPFWKTIRIIGGVLLVAAWLPTPLVIWSDRPYLLDLASHFALHAAALECALVLVLLAMRRWRSAVVVALAAISLTTAAWWHFAPARSPARVPGGRILRIVHYNAYGATTRHDDVFLEWLKREDADLVCIVDVPWNLPKTQPWLAARYPYRIEPAHGVEWPNLLLSKHPAQIQKLAPYSIDTKFSFVARRSLRVEIEGIRPFIFTALHPASPRKTWTWRLALEQVERDGRILREWLERGGAPVILCTDANSTPMGRVHRTLARGSGMKGWTKLLTGGTWPAALPTWLSLPIDRVWTSPGIEVRRLEVGPRFRSDHRAVVMEVELLGN